jgi:hypothetical protein
MWQLNPMVWVKWLTALNQKVDKIMSTLADLKAVLDGINGKMVPLKAGVDALLAAIAALQASAGGLTTEQQALVDGMVTEATGISAAADAIQGEFPVAAPAPAPAPATTS